MKKGVLIGIIIVVVILVVAGGIAYFYVNTKKIKSSCIKEGEMGDGMHNDSCCSGLGRMLYSSPSPDGKQCSSYGTQFTCSKTCGNGKCDSGENNCNCERDCPINESVCGNGICEAGEADEGPNCPPNIICPAHVIAGTCPQDCNPKGYICPTQKGINCMPIVKDEFVKYCSGNYHNWIVQNCNITFTY